MAETPEGKVKRWVKERLKRDYPGAWIYWAPGGMFGRAGTPDCLFVWRGVFVGLEVKAEGGRASALQLRSLQQISEAGGIAAVCYGRDSAKMDAIFAAVMARIGELDAKG